MSAPTPTARGTPAGIHLEDGFSSKITFASNATLSLWEKSINAPGLDGGEPVPQTTMFNTVYRTMAPRKLKTLTPHTFMGAYDPNIYNLLISQINVKDTVTITFPDGSTLAFFGFLQKFEPGPLVEGTQPEASCTVVPTNADPTTGAEQSAVLTSVAGT